MEDTSLSCKNYLNADNIFSPIRDYINMDKESKSKISKDQTQDKNNNSVCSSNTFINKSTLESSVMEDLEEEQEINDLIQIIRSSLSVKEQENTDQFLIKVSKPFEDKETLMGNIIPRSSFGKKINMKGRILIEKRRSFV